MKNFQTYFRIISAVCATIIFLSLLGYIFHALDNEILNILGTYVALIYGGFILCYYMMRNKEIS